MEADDAPWPPAAEIPEHELYRCVEFPSFWKSRKHLCLTNFEEGVSYCFVPDAATVSEFKALVRASEELDPGPAQGYYRLWGRIAGGVGLFVFLAGGFLFVLATQFESDPDHTGLKAMITSAATALVGVGFLVYAWLFFRRAAQLKKLDESRASE